jgi:hypothetical protein
VQIDVESRERLVRVETKLDALIDTVAIVAKAQKDCPARNAYLSRQSVNADDDLRRSRWIARTGWGIALLGGAMNFGPKLVELIKKLI